MSIESYKHVKRFINNGLGRLFGLEIQLVKYHPPNTKARDSLKPFFTELGWSKAIKLEYGVFDIEYGELFVFHDSGLFSCLSVTLWCICDLLALGYMPRKINFSGTFSAYKDALDVDIYSRLFETNIDENFISEILKNPKSRFKRFDHHGDYGGFDSELHSLLVRTYLQLNETVVGRAQLMRSRYIIPEQRYVGVCIRGTDKSVEVPPTDSALYIEITESLLSRGLVDRILIQTDQAQICNLFKGYFGSICDVIEDLPRTNGRIVVHKSKELDGQRVDFARNMLAAVSIISTMPYVVTHSGNVGAWIVLMRGSSENVWQATKDGIVQQ